VPEYVCSVAGPFSVNALESHPEARPAAKIILPAAELLIALEFYPLWPLLTLSTSSCISPDASVTVSSPNGLSIVVPLSVLSLSMLAISLGVAYLFPLPFVCL